MNKPRLHQFLSKTGIFKSKKDLVFAVKNSEIKINGKVITNIDYQFNPNKNKVYYNGKELSAVDKKVYLIVNKPVGFLSSRLTPKDLELGKKSIFSLFDKEKDNDKNLDEATKKTLFCIGRLDENSFGLIIVTNDGALGSLITRPESNITKTYEAVLEKPINSDDIKKIEKGVVIKLEENGVVSEYKTKPCRITLLDKNDCGAKNKIIGLTNKLSIEVTEGKKREVRRIFEAVSNKVKLLKRIGIGRIKLEELNIEEGSYMFVEKNFIVSKI
ncbi:TPA: rRNA pseudouridine synthase [Candidatus Woesearchaeota archaeon]|nr:rRNA pseudouridine synthase [Candidatus Woesearchaeota archaeon]